MGIETISKAQYRAGEIMARYRMSQEDMAELMKIAVDAGIEICLTEQERIREQNEAMVARAFVGPGLVH